MFSHLWTVLLILWASKFGAAAQIPVVRPTPVEGRVPGILDGVAADRFTTLEHPAFPRHSARIQKVDFCDPTVNVYTGYLDIESRHLFFYFFESRSDPRKDDVIYWTNGGPGASPAVGLLIELGPCRFINASEGTKPHLFSWNTNANLLLVDQPAGVGYSFEDFGHLPTSSESAAQDIVSFLGLFFTCFPSLQGRRLHMAGESYGGRYVPLFASAVHDQNAALVKAGLEPINLISALIGNGLTDRIDSLLSYYDYTCTPAAVPPLFNISTCLHMKAARARCERWTTAACREHFDLMDCAAAEAFCAAELEDPFATLGLNFYDISEKVNCSNGVECYPILDELSRYLNRTDVREVLGVDARANTNITAFSWEVFRSMIDAGDMLHSSKDHVAALLSRGVRVLLYVGVNDFTCNWIGNEKWSRELEWFGHDDFAAQPLREWGFNGMKAGKVRSAHGFTFATVDDAGHMVPYNQPEVSLALVQRWIADRPL
ncbi:Alpha/Beta hydrolase protein [Gloeopeniophorella convolvens]|nr:Alpha/Beta hydrolase protein [Gloeopeniophorella convolvens]